MSPNESENKAPEGDVPPPVEDAEPDKRAKHEAPTERPVGDKSQAQRRIERTRASGWWAGLIIAAIVLIFLLIFILQNLESVELDFLMFNGSLPLGVAMLLAAIGGVLMVAVPGIFRMIQLRRQAKR